MGFRENLKNELVYANMMVKELAEQTGISLRTLHSYLCEKGSIPAADVAVKIARTLGVSVEYLVCGKKQEAAPLNLPISRATAKIMDNLSEKSQEIVFALVNVIHDKEIDGT